MQEELKYSYSEKFVEGMKNRIVTSHYNYGRADKAYPVLAQALECAKERIQEYEKTKNTERLIDTANFCMHEFMYPCLENTKFEPTDSDKSIRLAGGISYKELMKEVNVRPITKESIEPALKDVEAAGKLLTGALEGLKNLCSDTDYGASEVGDTTDDISSGAKAFQKSSSDNNEINHPSYYNKGSRECIDIMRDLFGDEAVKWFCRCNSFKYRFSAGDKPDNDAEKDLMKAEWYEDYLHKMNVAEHDKMIFLEKEENGKI